MFEYKIFSIYVDKSKDAAATKPHAGAAGAGVDKAKADLPRSGITKTDLTKAPLTKPDLTKADGGGKADIPKVDSRPMMDKAGTPEIDVAAIEGLGLSRAG